MEVDPHFLCSWTVNLKTFISLAITTQDVQYSTYGVHPWDEKTFNEFEEQI